MFIFGTIQSEAYNLEIVPGGHIDVNYFVLWYFGHVVKAPG